MTIAIWRRAFIPTRRSRAFRPAADVLEGRQLLADPSLSGANPISAFAGVGLRLNPVASVIGTRNGVPDTNPESYSATIDWGDGKQSEGVMVRSADSSRVIIKGSHTYTDAKSEYPVTVTVRGPEGNPVTKQTTVVHVTLMPDVRSRPGQEPPAVGGTVEPAQATVTISGANPLSSYARVGFVRNPIGILTGTIDTRSVTDPDQFRAFVNWGDSPEWDEAELAPSHDNRELIVKGSHIYADPGQYQIVVYAIGPDGQTASRHTTQMIVSAMPLTHPEEVQTPGRYDMGSGPKQSSVTINGVNPLSATAGEELLDVEVGRGGAMVNLFTDFNPGHYKAQVNWGDSGEWTEGEILLSNSQSSPIVVRGSHTYQQPGTYRLVVHLTGPDGQTATRETTTVVVRPKVQKAIQITSFTITGQELNPIDASRCLIGTLAVRGDADDILTDVTLEVIQGGRVVGTGFLTPSAQARLLGRPLEQGGVRASGHIFMMAVRDMAGIDARHGKTVTFRVRVESEQGGSATKSTPSSKLLVGRAGAFAVGGEGQFTFDAEGFETANSSIYQTRLIHWPGGRSGVTIGRGYDLGGRTREQAYNALVAAGVPPAQARQIAAGAGLTGSRAGAFVRRHRTAIGAISPEAQRALFRRIYPGYVSKARRLYNAANRDARGRTLPGTVAWERLHPAIRTMLTDLTYQGLGFESAMRAARRNNINALIRYIQGRNSIMQYENGRHRLDFLRHARDGGCGAAVRMM